MKKDPRFTAFVVAIIGVVVLCSGVGLRFYASDMGAAAVVGMANFGMSFAQQGGPNSNYQSAMLLANRSNALYDVATVLMWTGGALVVLAAVAVLFRRSGESARSPEPARASIRSL